MFWLYSSHIQWYITIISAFFRLLFLLHQGSLNTPRVLKTLLDITLDKRKRTTK